MTELIGFEKFSFKYDAQVEPTLQDISLTIKKGEKILIVGPSGSGKSTLGQVLNGIIPNSHQGQEKGVFTLGGKDAFALSIYEKSQLVSTVLQDTDGQFIGLTVAEDLAFALENDGLAQSEMKQLVADWAERLELTDLLKHRPQDLSGGQKQRVSLAGVLIDESPILLFDEPLANLDPHTGQTTIELIDQMHASLGATTIIIEHRLEDVLHRSVDRIILMVEGRIAFDGSPDQLLKTSLLAEAGIREPLYLTSLRDWGYDLTKADSLSQLDRLDLSELVISPVAKDQESPARETLLEVRDLTVAYEPDRPIIKDLSLDLYRGELLALVGKNGAGKSTLAKALCQFIASEGQVTYQGQDISGDSIAQRAGRIGYVLQNPNQMISQSLIFDEVALGLRLRGLDEAAIEERVHQALKTCGLYPFRKWPISALSYGQKKRVTIASILVLNPEIILLDEPTAGQDLRHYQEMMDFLSDLSQAGHTVVMVTHDMQLMLEYADRAVVLVDGEILAEGSPSAILSDPELVQAANLKETSLYQLAKSLGLDPLALTQDYIDRRRKSHV